ncbi:MAG: hypothetical protein GX913_02630 [Clostridiales bacterium]|nr:hypothetical protein [Clostridiales bacterium]
MNAKEEYGGLIKELKAYSSRSVRLMLEGKRSTPDEIATAYMVLEDGCYMRDYIADDSGKIVELWFEKVLEH